MEDVSLRSLFKVTSKTTIVRAFGMMVGIFVNIAIARLLGPTGLGLINLSNQIVGILAMFALLGLPSVILKEVSIGKSNNNLEKIANVLHTSYVLILPFAFIILLLIYFLSPYVITSIFDESLVTPLLIIAPGIVFIVYNKIRTSGLNGLNKIWQSSLLDQTLSIVIVGLSLLIQYLIGWPITIITTAISYTSSRAIVSIVLSKYWKSCFQIGTDITNKLITKKLLKVSIPLLFVQATNTIANSIDSILIGSFLGSAEVGLYNVAFKIAFVTSFFLQIIASVLSPKVAALYANNEVKKLEVLLQKTTAILIIAAIFGLIVVIYLGEYALRIWGDEFIVAYLPLVILSIGQFINISSGVVFLVLTHCGKEKVLGYLTLSSSVLNTLLNIFLIQHLGIIGASIATAFTMSITNIAGILILKKKIGITTLPFNTITRLLSNQG